MCVAAGVHHIVGAFREKSMLKRQNNPRTTEWWHFVVHSSPYSSPFLGKPWTCLEFIQNVREGTAHCLQLRCEQRSPYRHSKYYPICPLLTEPFLIFLRQLLVCFSRCCANVAKECGHSLQYSTGLMIVVKKQVFKIAETKIQ